MESIDISKLLTQSDRKHIIEEKISKNWLSICVEYNSVFSNAKTLRDFIHSISEFFKFENGWDSKLTLIADEMNNNAIEYGSLGNEVNKMKIDIIYSQTDIMLQLEVEDTWNWVKHKNAQEMNALQNEKKDLSALSHKWIRWRGLFLIISKIVDKLYFKDSPEWWLIVGIQKAIPVKN